MAISKLHITNFRNLSSVSIMPELRGINIIEGENASGKTSLLEAIYFLSLGRSFRTHLAQRIIHHEIPCFSLFAETASLTDQTNRHHIGIEKHRNGQGRIRLNGADIKSAAKLAEVLPLQLIHPHSFQLLEGSPVLRRHFIDWGVFHVEHSFISSWKQYMRALKQRNVALKQRAPTVEIEAWNHELMTWGLPITAWRINYVRKFMEYLAEITSKLLAVGSIQIEYYQGWNQEETFEMALSRSLARDRMLTYTQLGPHHADLRFSIGGLSAKEVLSRGQQKLFICAMKIAQGQLFHQNNAIRCVYLIDDLVSELDTANQQKVLQLLEQQNCQMFITCTDHKQVIGKNRGTSVASRVFHVEHGTVSTVG